mmetsp:Transcript_42884/g.104857  ORF Transcript_42884/g.104857 Transcript_42884/m.104857 type:complete len:200 (+) Transcript_42884:806-1405(+)
MRGTFWMDPCSTGRGRSRWTRHRLRCRRWGLRVLEGTPQWQTRCLPSGSLRSRSSSGQYSGSRSCRTGSSSSSPRSSGRRGHRAGKKSRATTQRLTACAPKPTSSRRHVTTSGRSGASSRPSPSTPSTRAASATTPTCCTWGSATSPRQRSCTAARCSWTPRARLRCATTPTSSTATSAWRRPVTCSCGRRRATPSTPG